MVDKNRPGSWRPYKSSLCQSCVATCCTMPLEVKIEDLVLMGIVSEGEVDFSSSKSIQKIAKQLQKRGFVKSYRESTKLFLLESKPNGDCQFLESHTRLCKIYEIRPQVCRSFPDKMGLRLGFCPYLPKRDHK